ncbi:MAG: serine hydrolase domain-containing protein [Vicinamibacterales bacterium]
MISLARPSVPVVVALALLATAAPRAQQVLPRVEPASIGLAPDALADATRLLERFVAEGKIAGAVAAIAKDGKVGYLTAVGVQDLESRTPMTPRSLFRIYSMTKAVTAVAVMQLRDEGRFRLDDPVSNACPSSPTCGGGTARCATPRPPSHAITIEDLLLHTSGLSHRTSDLYRTLGVRDRTDTLTTFVRKITKAPLMEDPHTRFRYSEATTVLGRLVEIWSGQPFDRYLAARVLQPLGMSDTVFWVEGDRATRLATVYGPGPDGRLARVEPEVVPFTTKPTLLEGAVGLVSSVPDFLRFSQMLLDGGVLGGVRVLKAETAARMVKNGLSPDELASRGGPRGWGLGNVDVLVAPDGTGAPLGEYGWDGTAGTIFWNDPVAKTSIVLMTQSMPANPDRLRQQFKALAARAIR